MDTIDRPCRSIERLTSVFTEQARAISSLAQTVNQLVEAAQRSA